MIDSLLSRVLCIGSGVLDVLMKSSQFSITPVADQLMVCEIYGGKMDVGESLLASGGAGTNTAVSFSRQGFNVACVIKIGTDIAAQVILDDLLRDHVETSFIIEQKELSTGVSTILVAKDGSRSAMTYRGASHSLSTTEIDMERYGNLKAIHLSSVGDIELIAKISRFCSEHKIFLSWNPSKTEAEEIFLRSNRTHEFLSDILYVNDLEWGAIEKNASLVKSSTKMLVVTRGKNGGEITQGDKTQTFEAKKGIQVVDETGAGDAFASGLTGGLMRGQTLDNSIQYAIENATGVVEHMGAKEGLIHLTS